MFATLMLCLVAGLAVYSLMATGMLGGVLLSAAALPFGMLLRDPGAGEGAGGGGGGAATFETKVLDGVKKLTDGQKALEGKITALETAANKNAGDITELRKLGLGRNTLEVRQPGLVTTACARHLAAMFILGNAKSGRLDLLDAQMRSSLFDQMRSVLGIEAKAAITTTDIPLPDEYFSEVRELISEFGVVRRKMMRFPIGRGTAKPPRFKTRPSFGSIAMSAAFAEKSPQIDFASLESHKLGGIVRVPREIDEQSIVPMGQFLARYGAVEFARAEDTWGFLADGTATYENVKGVCKIATDAGKVRTLAAGKTKPSDATKTDFRNMRTLVNKAALSAQRSAYYLDSTWEVALREMNTEADPYFFVVMPDGTAKIDGYPVIWTDVLTPYGEAASVSSYLAVFGALDWWWFGEHGSPRMDFSSDVYFTTDELATRFIEEIDFDYQQVDVTCALATPAA
jgi:HK97 family phage major capsid protein